ncbi:MAG: DUF4293 family protein [Bacteroidia bacterium]|nr:DUF4293 family protein [Bacteroidia bacterium]
MRAQSVFLFIIAAAGMIMLFLPVSTIKITTSGFEDSTIRTIEMSAFGKTEIISGENTSVSRNKLLPLSIILSVVISLVIVLLYRNRQWQMKLCALNYVSICLTLVLIFFYCDLQTSAKNILVNSKYHMGAMLPFVQLLANFFAIRGIKLDARALNVMEQL